MTRTVGYGGDWVGWAFCQHGKAQARKKTIQIGRLNCFGEDLGAIAESETKAGFLVRDVDDALGVMSMLKINRIRMLP